MLDIGFTPKKKITKWEPYINWELLILSYLVFR